MWARTKFRMPWCSQAAGAAWLCPLKEAFDVSPGACEEAITVHDKGSFQVWLA